MERRHTNGNSRFLSSEQIDKRVGYDPGKQHADCHDASSQFQSHGENLVDTIQLPCAVVIAYQRTDALNDPVSGQINKSLQLIINTKHQHIALGKSCQNPVKC